MTVPRPFSGEPVDGLRWFEGDGEGFFVCRTGDLAAENALRERMGNERFAAWQRARELLKNPRPLTGEERSVLRRTLAPVLADLAASGLSPDIREEAHEERELPSVCAWIQGPGGTGEGIAVPLGFPPAHQVTHLAEQFQNWAADQLHDAGLAPEWPACPWHPGRQHRLEPEVRDGRAVWMCLISGEVFRPVGELAIS